jgi:Transcriptional regulator
MKLSTADCITVAMKKLASSRPIDKISVEDICQAAGCSRPTFYKYFPDKYAACYSVYLMSSEKILEDYSSSLDLKTMLTEALGIIQSDWPFYKNLIKDVYAQNSFFTQYIEHGMKTNSALIGKAKLTPDLKKILYGYTVGGAHIILQWMQGGIKEPPENIADVMCRLVPGELREYLLRA